MGEMVFGRGKTLPGNRAANRRFSRRRGAGDRPARRAVLRSASITARRSFAAWKKRWAGSLRISASASLPELPAGTSTASTSSTGLGGFFEFVVTCENERHAKPNPRGYLAALKRLSLDANECLAVEDSPRSARAAIAAGIPCVVIPTLLTDLALCPPHCKILGD